MPNGMFKYLHIAISIDTIPILLFIIDHKHELLAYVITGQNITIFIFYDFSY